MASEVDPSIVLAGKPVQIDNPQDVQAKAFQLRQLGLSTQAAQRDFDNQNTLANIYRQNIGADGSVNHAAIMTGMAQSGLGAQIPAYQKSLLDVQKTQADIAGTQATTATSQFDLHQKNLGFVAGKLNALQQGSTDPTTGQTIPASPQDVMQAIHEGVNGGYIDQATGAQMARAVPGNPAQIPAFLARQVAETQTVQQQIQAAKDRAPKLENTGGALTSIDPLTGKPTGAAPIPLTASPDSVMSASTSRANNAANIAKDYTVAGMNPDGSPGQVDSALVDQIGQNRIIPSARLQATPRGQAILAAVEAKYPGYDVTTAEAKQTAAKAFTTGPQGSALRSIGTATKHLDMLDGLVSALGNGDTPLLNKLGNAWSAQTGGTAPGNFDAAKEIVGQEVTKAIVAGGGGVSERAEAAAALSNAKSPQQLRGVISTYKTIMGAQHESLLQQRDAAGLPRSTLPDYTEGAPGAPGSPATARPPLSAFGSK